MRLNSILDIYRCECGFGSGVGWRCFLEAVVWMVGFPVCCGFCTDSRRHLAITDLYKTVGSFGATSCLPMSFWMVQLLFVRPFAML